MREGAEVRGVVFLEVRLEAAMGRFSCEERRAQCSGRRAKAVIFWVYLGNGKMKMAAGWIIIGQGRKYTMKNSILTSENYKGKR